MLQHVSTNQLLDSLTSGALILSSEGVVLYANPIMQVLSGISELIGLNANNLLHLPDKTQCPVCLGQDQVAEVPESHAAILAGLQSEISEQSLRVKVKHSLLPDGHWLCLIDPFSEDATLAQAHGDFISTVSHEFRTPLTSIKGFSDTLLQYGNQLPEDEKRRFITIIKDQAERLTRLVENLLTVSRLGSSRLESCYRSIPLQKLIEKVTQNIQAKVKSKHPTVTRHFEVTVRPLDLEVWADADRLEQILLNLIDNAVKYSSNDSQVRVTGELLPDDENWIRIAVQDNGVGLAPEALPKIFTQFYRVESPLTQDVEGTGLGLYITKSLVNAMGGQLSVESALGMGSTFTVLLPAYTPELQARYRRHLYVEDLDA